PLFAPRKSACHRVHEVPPVRGTALSGKRDREEFTCHLVIFTRPSPACGLRSENVTASRLRLGRGTWRVLFLQVSALLMRAMTRCASVLSSVPRDSSRTASGAGRFGVAGHGAA